MAPSCAQVRLLNYRRDGSAFWNNLHVAPIRDNSGQVAFFVGVQLDITLTPKADALASCTESGFLEVRRHSSPGDSTCQSQGGDGQSDGQCPLDSAAYLQGQKPLLATSSAPVGLQAGEPSDRAKRAQQAVVGAVRVACRALGSDEGLRRSLDCQHRASMDMPLRRLSSDAQGARRSVDGALFRLPSRLGRC